MKRLLLGFTLALCLAGCSWLPDAKASKVNLDYWEKAAPYAKAGIDASDLSDAGKRIRKRSIDKAVEHARSMVEATQ